MRDLLTARALDRTEREQVSVDVFVDEGYHKSFPRLVIGGASFFDPKKKKKFVDDSVWPISNSEVAREYLTHIWEEQKMPERGRVGFNKQTGNLLDYHPPLYMAERTSGDYLYVDIDRAFYQIIAPVTLDLYFNPWREALMLGRVEFLEREWLGTEKNIYRALIGLTRARRIDEFRYGVRQPSKKTYNRYLAPQLWGYIAFTLNYLAHEAINKFPIYYWHCDGAIIDRAAAPLLMEYLWDRWRLVSSVRYPILSNRLRGNRDYPARKKILDYNPYLADKMRSWRMWALRVNSPGAR
jgi:hypothetical protein